MEKRDAKMFYSNSKLTEINVFSKEVKIFTIKICLTNKAYF